MKSNPRFNAYQRVVTRGGLGQIYLANRRVSVPCVSHTQVLYLASIVRKLPAMFARTVSLKIVPVKFGSFGTVCSVVSSNVSKFVVPSGGCRRCTRAVLQLTRSSALHYRVTCGTRGQGGECSVRRMKPL